MSGEPLVTIVGNLGADPELRFTTSGAAVCNFSVASTPRVKMQGTDDWEDGTRTWFNCSVWREFAENVAESLSRGDRVIVQGYMSTREYENRDGVKGKSLELNVQAIGPDLRYATAKVTKASRSGGSTGRSQGSPAAATPAADPWATPAADEPPF